MKWKWTPSTAANGFNPSGTRRGVSVGDGKVYTLAGGNRVVALDKDTGAMVWAVQPTGPGGVALGNIAKVGTVYWDGMVYIGTNDGNRGAGFAVRVQRRRHRVVVLRHPRARHPVVYRRERRDHGRCRHVGINGLRAAIRAGRHGSTRRSIPSWAWSTTRSATCAAATRRRTAASARATISSATRSSRSTPRPAPTSGTSSPFATTYGTWTTWRRTVLGDVQIGGETKKAVYYGSKSSLTFILDRTNGKPLTPVVEVPVPTDSRQVQPVTQKFPAIGNWQTKCIVYEKLGTDNIPGSPWRAVPNYNGYQPDANGNLVYTEPNYLDVDKPFLTVPAGYGSAHRRGCLYDTQWDFPVLATTTQNGGNDFSGQAFVQHRNMYIVPYGYRQRRALPQRRPERSARARGVSGGRHPRA